MAVHEVCAPMVASVLEVNCSVGELVDASTELIVLESMKMEVPLEAGASGTVAEVLVGEGDAVDEGAVLIRINV